jgi:hypothetical protein
MRLDPVRAIVWSFILLYCIGVLVVCGYFIHRAFAGNERPVSCSQPAVAQGHNWGISAIDCSSKP